jgi:pyruvate ferredoxin oxidoreductase gamma subunit
VAAHTPVDGALPGGRDVFEVRLHGRGGQGTVTAAALLSVAAFEDGRHAQAFPSFGSERMGAPVEAYCRISDRPVRTREPVVEPDALIIQDPTLLHQVGLFAGLRPDGWVLLNTEAAVGELGLDTLAARLRPDRLVTVPATELARIHLGRPIANSALLGGFAALTGAVTMDGLARAFRRRFPGEAGERNVVAAAAAFAHVQREEVAARAGAD